MTTEEIVLLKMLGSVLVAAIILFFMAKRQRKKEADAEDQYQLTLKVIELRNKKIGDKNEP